MSEKRLCAVVASTQSGLAEKLAALVGPQSGTVFVPISQVREGVVPHLVVVDFTRETFRSECASVVYEVRQKWPHQPFTLYTTNDSCSVAEAYSVGADIVLTTVNASWDEWISNVPAGNARSSLSKREAQVLFGFAGGHTRESLAETLFLGPETIKSYTRNLFVKFNVTSRLALIQKGFQSGMLPSPRGRTSGAPIPLTRSEMRAIYAFAEMGRKENAATLLGCSPLTIGTHVANVREKTGWTVSRALSNIWWWGYAQTVSKDCSLLIRRRGHELVSRL